MQEVITMKPHNDTKDALRLFGYILLTLVTGIGAAVVFQNLLRLWDNDEFPAGRASYQ